MDRIALTGTTERRIRGDKMKEERMDCPSGHGKMALRKAKKPMTFRGVKIIVPIEQYRCPVCGVEAGTVEQTARIQKTIAYAYRRAVNLLTEVNHASDCIP